MTEQLNAPSVPPPAPLTNQVGQPPKMVVANPQGVMKIGSSTISIKPGTLPTNTVIAAANDNKPVVVTTNDPPPLAPLSTQSNKTQTIVQTIAINPNNQNVSQKLTANKMLVDLLDKKGTDPPPVFGSTTIKRKSETEPEVPAKKADIETQRPEQIVSPSPKAADLYGKLLALFVTTHILTEYIYSKTGWFNFGR